MNGMKRGFVWWWPWQPEKVERYLEDMCRQGWKVSWVSRTCMGFRFERAENNNVRFCVDYQKTVSPDYRTLFLDAGWSILYESMGWFLWSKAYPEGGERPEIYTDVESLMQRNKGMLALVAALLAIQTTMLGLFLRFVENHGPALIPLFVLYILFYLLLAYGVIRLSVGMGILKKRKKN